MGDLTRNFSLSEFKSKDGAGTPLSLICNISELAENLQALRDAVDKPIIINSGYRSPKHNKAVGGSPNSQHLKGKAADIVISLLDVHFAVIQAAAVHPGWGTGF